MEMVENKVSSREVTGGTLKHKSGLSFMEGQAWKRKGTI